MDIKTGAGDEGFDRNSVVIRTAFEVLRAPKARDGGRGRRRLRARAESHATDGQVSHVDDEVYHGLKGWRRRSKVSRRGPGQEGVVQERGQRPHGAQVSQLDLLLDDLGRGLGQRARPVNGDAVDEIGDGLGADALEVDVAALGFLVLPGESHERPLDVRIDHFRLRAWTFADLLLVRRIAWSQTQIVYMRVDQEKWK